MKKKLKKLIKYIQKNENKLRVVSLLTTLIAFSGLYFLELVGTDDLMSYLLFLVIIRFSFPNSISFFISVLSSILLSCLAIPFLGMEIVIILFYSLMLILFSASTFKHQIQCSEIEIVYQSLIFALFSISQDYIYGRYLLLFLPIYVVFLLYSYKGKKVNSPEIALIPMALVTYICLFLIALENFEITGIITESIMIGYMIPRLIFIELLILSIKNRKSDKILNVNLENMETKKTKLAIYSTTALVIILVTMFKPQKDTYDFFIGLMIYVPFIGGIAYWYLMKYIKKPSE